MLEAFFAEEQFPSRADKMFLAKKAGMSYRQIHVWVSVTRDFLSSYLMLWQFQNRRTRTRRMQGVTDISDNPDLNQCGSSEDTDVEDASAKVTLSPIITCPSIHLTKLTVGVYLISIVVIHTCRGRTTVRIKSSPTCLSREVPTGF